MAKHAYLSASASHRWLACPPSAKLCALEEDKSSEFAMQGTSAHELGQYLLEKALGLDVITDSTVVKKAFQDGLITRIIKMIKGE